MRNSLKTIGKVTTLLASTALLMATTAVIPAEAANKAGASCTKSNAKTKIGGDSYICTKNPTAKNAKLTWVWIGCIDSNKLYLDAAADLGVARQFLKDNGIDAMASQSEPLANLAKTLPFIAPEEEAA